MDTRLYRATAVALLIAMKIGWDLVFSPMNTIGRILRELERYDRARHRGDLDYAVVLNPSWTNPNSGAADRMRPPLQPAPVPDLERCGGALRAPGPSGRQNHGPERRARGRVVGPAEALECQLVSFTREEAVFANWREQNRLTIRLRAVVAGYPAISCSEALVFFASARRFVGVQGSGIR